MQCYTVDKISDKDWLTPAEQQQVIVVIGASFSGVDSKQYFASYFAGKTHFRRCVRLFYQNGQLVGYCLLTFRQNADNSIVMGASAAFLPDFRGNNNTFAFSIRWAVKTWLCQLNRNVYYLDTMLSPAMYRAMGKRVAVIYPNPDMTADEMSQYQALVVDAEQSNWQGLHCLKTVGRASNYSAEDLARLKASNKAEMAFYCSVNPNFAQGTALLVLIPVNLKQLTFTLWKWLKGLMRGHN